MILQSPGAGPRQVKTIELAMRHEKILDEKWVSKVIGQVVNAIASAGPGGRSGEGEQCCDSFWNY